MPEYVARIIGRLNPPLTVVYKDFTEPLPSFSVTVEKEKVNAVLHTNLQLEADAARERLQHEISPLLTVIGVEEGRAIELEITNIIYPNFGTATPSIATRFVLREAVPDLEEIHQKVRWASVDPIYRDLLDLYTEAQAAPNPRPAGAKLVERLMVKFNGHPNALTRLGMSSDGFDLIKKKQFKYKGDRHADYKEGYVPTRLSHAERNEILAVLKQIIYEYENRVCATLP